MGSQPGRRGFLSTWRTVSSHVVESVVAANRAAFAVLGVTLSDEHDSVEGRTEHVAPDEDRPGWQAALTTDDPNGLTVGDQFEFTKTVTEDDVRRFAAASGDTNPLHLDADFAEETRFRGRIAHGTLVGGLISAALARVPGMVVYLSQNLEFHDPVRIGDRLTAECELVEALGNSQYRLATTVRRAEVTVVGGEATIMVDDRPTGSDAD